MSLFSELKRRNVFRVAAAYVVISWLLIQVIGLAADSFSAPEWVMKMIIVVLLIGFIPALFFSWAFELTPEGIKRETDIVTEQSITNYTAKKLDVITLVAVILVAGLLFADRYFPQQITTIQTPVTQTSATKNSVTSAQAGISSKKSSIQANTIAVLPFSDLSKNKDQEYFSDGMAEEILNVLVRVDALKVTSRTSAFQFKGQEIGIPEIAKKLKVRHVLEGSVRKSGNTLRITAQLIDAQNDKHLWSKTYDRPLTTDNIFAIQDEISHAIVEALKDALGLVSVTVVDVQKTTQNLSAYELFLQARPLFQARKELDKADALLIQAIKLDPKFAQAWAMRAALQSLMYEYGFSKTPVEQNDIKGLKFANKALSIKPNMALALAVKSKIRLNANEFLRSHYDYTEIINDYKKALSIDPHNPSTLNWIGLAYEVLGFREKALEYFNQCIDYEPRYAPCVGNAIQMNNTIGNYKIAVNLYRDNLSIGVIELGDAPFFALAQLNQQLAFISALNAPYFFPGWHRNGEIYQAYKNPQLDHAELTKAAYETLSEESKKLLWWRFVLSPLGYANAPNHDYIDVFGTKHKNIDNPKIKSYIKEAGIYDYWQQHGYPPQCRALPKSKIKDDFVCD